MSSASRVPESEGEADWGSVVMVPPETTRGRPRDSVGRLGVGILWAGGPIEALSKESFARSVLSLGIRMSGGREGPDCGRMVPPLLPLPCRAPIPKICSALRRDLSLVDGLTPRPPPLETGLAGERLAMGAGEATVDWGRTKVKKGPQQRSQSVTSPECIPETGQVESSIFHVSKFCLSV